MPIIAQRDHSASLAQLLLFSKHNLQQPVTMCYNSK